MLAQIVRTYGGQEGRRVKAGTVFTVHPTTRPGLIQISPARYQQLKASRLAAEFTGEQPAAPASRPADSPPRGRLTPRRGTAPTPDNKVEPDSQPKPAPNPRRLSRRRTQNEAPKEPRPLARRLPGGPDGDQEQAASSSPADHQVGSLTLKRRGVRGRRSGGSALTTPGPSAPGPMSSTDATAPGGAPTTTSSPAPESAAFD